ncbi:hypothetical protein EVAR_30995_1 [Eumeta japonica]|uniref:Uncharacterized protein n=1 Tax=Eumeta variegata TaxID=151549 RepID=A0A4C1W7G3_EUMVA|nr:hypothetical protein EVAR_30995_1 [Eumeta japonica]
MRILNLRYERSWLSDGRCLRIRRIRTATSRTMPDEALVSPSIVEAPLLYADSDVVQGKRSRKQGAYVLESNTKGAAGTYQKQTEKIIVVPGLTILAPPESTPCAWTPMAPPYLRH